jgi:hypothetical protein
VDNFLTKAKKRRFVDSKSRLTSMETIKKESTPKLLVETTMFARRYLRTKMKMTMILKES